jgi:S-adenosylmethionine:tRNA-ribosyltransferase-isomerase (queuine synthetase)
VRVEDIELHRMHKEHYEVPRATMDAIAGRRVPICRAGIDESA